MNIVRLVKQDHGEIRALLARLDSRRRDSLVRFRDAMDVHSRVEEEILYPAVEEARSAGAEDLVRDALEQHEIIDELLRALSRSEATPEKIRELCETVENHLRMEEDEVLGELESNTASERLDELGEEMETRKEALIRTHGAL